MTAEERRLYKREWNRLNKEKRSIYQRTLYETNQEYRLKQIKRSREQYKRFKKRKEEKQ